MTNVTHWIRIFRPPLQRAYGEDVCEIDLELTDLLLRADQRRAEAERNRPLPERSKTAHER